MNYPQHRSSVFARRQPELPAFCRTRRQRLTTVHPSSLRQLEMLLWLVLALQLSTILLVLAGPLSAPEVPAPQVRAQQVAAPGSFSSEVFASRHDAPVPSPSQP
jgi:hypothetical protein